MIWAMRSVTAAFIAATLLVVVVLVLAQPGPDTSVPPSVTAYTGPARQVAQAKGGLLAVLFGVRLADARCSPDGSLAALQFEGIGTRLFAVVGIAPASEVNAPGAVTTIVGLTVAEFAAEGYSQQLGSGC